MRFHMDSMELLRGFEKIICVAKKENIMNLKKSYKKVKV